MSSRQVATELDAWTATAARSVTDQRRPPVALVASTTTTVVEALNRAFAGEPCEVVRADGTSKTMAVARWRSAPSLADMALFVDHCTGPTLDVGCGPGRLTAALTERGQHALGIDISPEAVRQTLARGAAALCHDVFAELPGVQRWMHVLLADGIIGLGGDPVRLLARVAELLEPHGSAMVELAHLGSVTADTEVRLRVGHHISPVFRWATVGIDTIDALAADSGLRVSGIRHLAGRNVATLLPG